MTDVLYESCTHFIGLHSQPCKSVTFLRYDMGCCLRLFVDEYDKLSKANR